MGMDITGRNPSNKEGEYFRASIWSWRPIHKLCETVMGQALNSWAYNNGDGFETQTDCNKLADKLEAYLNKFPNEEISIESDIRVDETNCLFVVKPGRAGVMPGKSAYQTSHAHIRQFIKFLRSCGGFEIY